MHLPVLLLQKKENHGNTLWGVPGNLDLLSTVKRRKLLWVGHIARHETVTKGTWKEDVVKVNKRKRIDW